MSIADVLADTIRDKDRIKSDFASVGDVAFVFLLWRESVNVKVDQLLIESTNINNSFILNHPANGKVGVQSTGLQPLIGNQSSAKTILVDTRT